MSEIVYTIYMHTNVITGKSYVGLTKNSAERRWAEHVYIAFNRRLKSQYRRYHFQNSIKLYGVNVWLHSILQDSIPTIKEAQDAEVRWIADLETLSPNGYNETRGGGGVIIMTAEGKERHRQATIAALSDPEVHQRYLDGIRRSHTTPEFRKKNSAAQKIAQNRSDVCELKRKKMKERCSKSDYCSPVARRIEQLSLQGERIAVFKSAIEAAKLTGVNYCHLTEVARGLRRRSGGFVWRYLD